jgi:hypothetical protein
MDRIDLSDAQLEDIARRRVACPFVGPAVRRGELAVRNDAERPLAAIGDVVALGDRGGGDLGRRVLRIFATGNHRRLPGAPGAVAETTPPDMMSLDFAGSQGAHPGHSGIMLGDPARVGTGRFSPEDFDRLVRHADAEGRLDEEAVGRFIAENIARDPEARVFPVRRLVGDLFGVADEVVDSVVARLLRRRTPQDEAELLERLTRLTGADHLMASAGEWGLLFAFFANRPGSRPGLDLADLRSMMEDLRLPDGWSAWPKHATDWVRATTRIAGFALRARLRD